MSEILRREMQELLDAEPPDATFRARVISSLPDLQHTRTLERWHWLQGAVATLLALTVVAGLVYVGRATRQQPQVTPPAPTITQSDSGCVYDGPDMLPAGTVTIRLINHTSDYFYVHVLWFFDNHQYGELAAYIKDEQRRLRAGDSTIGPPAYVAEAAQDEVPPHSTLKHTAILASGSYGIVCTLSKEAGISDPADGISITGPLIVRSATSGSP